MIQADIGDPELVERLSGLEDDGMSVFVMADGRARGALFHGTRFVNQMRAQHKTGILETMVLGQASLCAALLIATMKGREHVTWRYEVDGPAKGFSVEADSAGYVRGYLLEPSIPVTKPLDDWNLAPFLGEGTITMSTVREGSAMPYTSSVAVGSRNIALDLASYFDQSEQIRTAFSTGIQMDGQGRVIGAGGLFLQLLPQAGGTLGKGRGFAAKNAGGDDLADRLERAVRNAPSLGLWFSRQGTREDCIREAFCEFAPTVALTRGIVYDCPCSKEYYAGYIRRLPREELDDMRANGPDPLEVTCRNCGSVYRILLADVLTGDGGRHD